MCQRVHAGLSACLNFVRHCFAVCFRGYLSVFFIDDNTKVEPHGRQEYAFGNIGGQHQVGCNAFKYRQVYSAFI